MQDARDRGWHYIYGGAPWRMCRRGGVPAGIALRPCGECNGRNTARGSSKMAWESAIL